jgi:hypothetical protein
MSIARRLLERARFAITPPPRRVVDIDASAVSATRR